MERKPLVLVPYRNRSTHLSCFLLYMRDHFSDMEIVVIEQIDSNPWNKGLLFNAGYKEVVNENHYLILHDVDFIPVLGSVDYGFCSVPTMIAGEASQFDYKLPYPQFFGGVVILSREHFQEVNGFSNQFKDYGGEDDLFYRSFTKKGIIPLTKNSRFECFAHPRPKREDHYRHNLQVLAQGRDFSEGLSTAQYEVVDIKRYHNYTHLKINTHYE